MPDPVVTQGTTGQTARDLLALDYKQNAEPSSPSAGDRWLRIDDASGLNVEPESGAFWERDSTNTYWFSEKIYHSDRNVSNIAVNDSIFAFLGTNSHDLYFLDFEVSFFIQATHNSTNYWQSEISWRNPSNTETSVQTINSWQTGRTITTWYRDRADIDQHLDISAVNFRVGNFRFTRIGSPGALFGSAILYYRLARAV